MGCSVTTRRGPTMSEEDFVGIEPGLIYGSRRYIALDQTKAEKNRDLIELIVRKLVGLMRDESPTFDYLYVDLFGGGSAYEDLKITAPDEFNIDVLMRIPEVAGPVLLENNIPGYVNLQLENFHDLERENPEVYDVMQTFVDEKNYLLTKEMKGSFMQSVFDRTVKNNFRNNIIRIGKQRFKISRVQNSGPAFTLTIAGPDFRVSVDLVPCILLDEDQWPGEAFKSNPYRQPSRIRDRFKHKVSSYAIKTIFMRQLELDNPDFDEEIPDLWLSPWSYCVVYMLNVYLDYLRGGQIPYLWNHKLNLLDDLTDQQIDQYTADIEDLLQDIEQNPVPETILKYLR